MKSDTTPDKGTPSVSETPRTDECYYEGEGQSYQIRLSAMQFTSGQFERELAQVTKERDEARADSERLDWLDSEKGFPVITNMTAEKMRMRYNAKNANSQPLREVIDHARKETE